MKLSHTLFAVSICVALTSALGCSDESTGTTTSSGSGTSASGATSSGGGENKVLSDLAFADKVGVSLAKNSTKQYTLTAKYADGSSEDVTKSKDTTWNTTAPDIATVADGLVTAKDKTGAVTISAEYKGKKAEDSFAVGP